MRIDRSLVNSASTNRNEQCNMLVVSNGNDVQIPFVIQLYAQLRDPKRGAYTGKFIYLSDSLTDASIASLDQRKIPFAMIDSDVLESLNERYISDKHALGKLAKPAFIQYAIEKYAEENTVVLYLDPDIFIQGPIDRIFDMMDPEAVTFFRQEKDMNDTPWCVSQLHRCIVNGHFKLSQFHSIKEEINTGIIVGFADVMEKLVKDWSDFIAMPDMLRYAYSDPQRNNAWHDQDYFRCFSRLKRRHDIHIANNPSIIHLCSLGYHACRYIPHRNVFVRKRKPFNRMTLVHMAGGTHKHYDELSEFYDPVLVKLEGHNHHMGRKPRIAIFGTGQASANATKLLNTRCHIEMYVDNNEERLNKSFMDKPVVSPDSAIQTSIDYIVIASGASASISEQLLQMGYCEDKILSIREPLLSKIPNRVRSRRRLRRKQTVTFLIGFLSGVLMMHVAHNGLF